MSKEKEVHPLILHFLKSKKISDVEEYLKTTENLNDISCLSSGITQLFSEEKFETEETDFTKDGYLIIKKVNFDTKELEVGAKYVKFISKLLHKTFVNQSKEEFTKNYQDLAKTTFQSFEVSDFY